MMNNVRRKISITLITNFQNSYVELTKHQLIIKANLKRWYVNTKQHALLSKLLKHELNATKESLQTE